MTVLIVAETVVLIVLAVLVAGLLRSHAEILRRLHSLEGAPEQHRPATEFRLTPALPQPPAEEPHQDAVPDIAGLTPSGDAAAVRVSGMQHDTVIAFLSGTCSSCAQFWTDFADPATLRLPDNTRLVVVTKDAAEESPSSVAAVAPPHVDVVMSSEAWAAYKVPGAPYVVAVDGASGKVRGEGTGLSWTQVARMLTEATGDIGFLASTAKRDAKPVADADREVRVDRELIGAGILPGDPRLYPRSQEEMLSDPHGPESPE